MSDLSTRNNVKNRHSDDIQNIIATPPSWLLRYGTTLCLLILITIGGIAALISYSDVVEGTLSIESKNDPSSYQPDIFKGKMYISNKNLGLLEKNKVVLIKMKLIAKNKFTMIEGCIERISTQYPSDTSIAFLKLKFNPSVDKNIYLKSQSIKHIDADFIFAKETILKRIYIGLLNAIHNK